MNPKSLVAQILAMSTSLYLTGCLPDGAQPTGSPESIPESSTGIVTLATQANPAARAAAAEPGGTLVAEIRQASKRLSYRDSAAWSGQSSFSLRFPSIPEGTGYQAIVTYRDPAGLATHADTVQNLSVARATNTQAVFKLKALLGRIQLVVPTAPVAIDSLRLAWESNGVVRSAKAVRGPSGRTTLRLDSLAVGSTGTVRVRAWTIGGDTLYFADTSVSIQSQADQALQIRMLDARGQASSSVSFLAGGETDAVALFPLDQNPSGRLVLAALSDSGSNDWIKLENRSTDSVIGPARIVRGTESFGVDLRLAPGASVVLTRASCEAVAQEANPLHSTNSVVCGLAGVSVSWSSTGTLWEIRTTDGALADQVVILDGKLGWPDLNGSTARTVWRNPAASVVEASAGRSWCADASDSPAVSACL
jgi:hypothetical protein